MAKSQITLPSAVVTNVQCSSKRILSKSAVEKIALIKNWGVEGDCHAGTTDQHTYHVRKFGSRPNLRQVHLIHGELFDELMTQGYVVRPGELGENVVTRNIDLLNLPTGTRLHLGARAMIELTGLREPCVKIDRFQKGLLKQLVEKTGDGAPYKSGVMSIVLESGVVQPGDPIEVEMPRPPYSPLIYRNPAMEAGG